MERLILFPSHISAFQKLSKQACFKAKLLVCNQWKREKKASNARGIRIRIRIRNLATVKKIDSVIFEFVVDGFSQQSNGMEDPVTEPGSTVFNHKV